MNPFVFKLALKICRNQGKVVHSFVKTDVRDKTDILRGLSHLKGIHALAFINNIDQVRMKEMKLNIIKHPLPFFILNMTFFERQEALGKFPKGELRILIATDLAARGLDIEGLTHVIHVDAPIQLNSICIAQAEQDAQVRTEKYYRFCLCGRARLPQVDKRN